MPSRSRIIISLITLIQFIYVVHATGNWISGANKCGASANPIPSLVCVEVDDIEEGTCNSNNSPIEDDAETTIQSFLSSTASEEGDKFYIQGE